MMHGQKNIKQCACYTVRGLWDRRLPGASGSVPLVDGQSGVPAALSAGRHHDGSVAA